MYNLLLLCYVRFTELGNIYRHYGLILCKEGIGVPLVKQVDIYTATPKIVVIYYCGRSV